MPIQILNRHAILVPVKKFIFDHFFHLITVKICLNFFLTFRAKTLIFSKKLMTTYSNGFQALPLTVASCITASTDYGNYLSPGCGFCEPNLLANVNQCTLKSNDGLSTTICSQQNNGNMINVTSCFSGTFSLNNGPLASPTPNQQACNVQFCKVSQTCFFFL